MRFSLASGSLSNLSAAAAERYERRRTLIQRWGRSEAAQAAELLRSAFAWQTVETLDHAHR